MDHWTFSVDDWELGDTLGDITRGRILDSLPLLVNRQDFDFRPSTQKSRSVEHVRWNEYAVTAEVVFVGEENWAIDFGFPAVPNRPPPPGASVGSFLEGTIRLGSLTAGSFLDDLFEAPAPPLACTWCVERIWLNTTPWLNTEGAWVLADVPPTFEEIEATDHYNAPWPPWDYLLECRLLDGPYQGWPGERQ